MIGVQPDGSDASDPDATSVPPSPNDAATLPLPEMPVSRPRSSFGLATATVGSQNECAHGEEASDEPVSVKTLSWTRGEPSLRTRNAPSP